MSVPVPHTLPRAWIALELRRMGSDAHPRAGFGKGALASEIKVGTDLYLSTCPPKLPVTVGPPVPLLSDLVKVYVSPTD